MTTERYKNDAVTQLAGAINGVQLTIDVIDAAVFPTLTGGDQFRVRIDDEEDIIVSSVAANTLTVVRGTGATSHSDGSDVIHNITASSLLNLPATVENLQTAETDTSKRLAPDGSGGVQFAAGGGSSAVPSFFNISNFTAPPSAGWTWDNQGTSTISSVTTDYGNNIEDLYVTKKAAVQLALRYRTAPATPYTATFCLLHDISGMPPGASGTGLNAGFVVGFRDAGGKLVGFIFIVGGGATNALTMATDKWTSSAAISADYTLYGPAPSVEGVYRNPIWLQISDDGTNLIFRWSLTGIAGTWRQFDTRLRGDFLTTGPNAYFYGAYANGCAVNVVLLSLKET